MRFVLGVAWPRLRARPPGCGPRARRGTCVCNLRVSPTPLRETARRLRPESDKSALIRVLAYAVSRPRSAAPYPVACTARR